MNKQIFFDDIDKDFVNYLNSYRYVFIYTVLKNASSAECPLSISKITSYANQFLDSEIDTVFTKRSIRRDIDDIIDFSYSTDPQKQCVYEFLKIFFCGSIEYVETEGKNGSKPQKRYYFSPLVEASDFNLIMGSIESNIYLSPEEKNFLRTRLSLLNPEPHPTSSFDDDDDEDDSFNYRLGDTNALSNYPNPTKDALPSKASTQLKHISTIYEAIENRSQLQISYGRYSMDKKDFGKLCFFPLMNGEFITINPYAMFWYNGKHYLIATKAGEDKVIHYRVDRIHEVKTPSTKNKSGERELIPREKLPDSLSAFFSKSKSGIESFSQQKYTSMYPHMYVHEEKKLIDCQIECNSQVLSILVDTFGTNFKVIRQKDENSGDTHSSIYIASIRGVQYENILKFASKHHEDFTVISPPELINDLKDNLRKSYERYQTL